ncbi:TetR/AcrR family transcriptional regulator [Nocardia xishanensis]
MTAEIPPVARLLWSGNPPAGRGPRPALTLERIVVEAIRVADADGIAALSMQRIAKQLGAATMSLYRHVPSKDDLVVLMIDGAMANPPELPEEDWRAALEAWARESRELYRRHPWLLAVGTGNRFMGPNEAAWAETAMRALLDAGLEPQGVAETVLSVTAFVSGATRLELDPALGRGAPGHVGPVLDPAVITEYGEPERYPALLSLTAAGSSDSSGADPLTETVFEFGLARLLDGIAAALGGPRSDEK